MKPLLWKEWRQNRNGFILVICAAGLFSILGTVGPPHFRVEPEFAAFIQCVIVLTYAAVVGVSLVAAEVKTDTIRELFARPINPFMLWLSKFLFGILTIAIVLVVAGSTMPLILRWAQDIDPESIWTNVAVRDFFVFLPILAGALFAASLFFSTLFETETGAAIAMLMLLILCIVVA